MDKILPIKAERTKKFDAWLKKLGDPKARQIIVSRISRFLFGLAGDVEPVGKSVYELRIHYGPGYRVYFYQKGDTFLLLLLGGDKSTQKHDIQKAQEILHQWRTENE